MSKVYISTDFDGTIVDHVFPLIGKPVPRALDWLRLFQDKGFLLILNTMRSDGAVLEDENRHVLSDAVNYLTSNGIKLYGVNHNPDQDSWTSSPKVYAHFYIDDAAVGCPLIYPISGRPYVDWDKVGKEILSKI